MVESSQHQEMKHAALTFGSSAFSFDVFESPGSYHWFPYHGKRGKGGIVFKVAHRTRIIVGDPLLHEDDWREAVLAFLALRRPLTVTMATFASSDFAKLALDLNGAAIEAQTEVSVNPQTWEASGPRTARIRQYSRKCEKQGLFMLRLKNANDPDEDFRKSAETLIADWKQNSLKRPGRVHEVNLWEACEHKEYFALSDEKKQFHALVVARPLPKRRGYYLWTARASKCATGAVEAAIATAIQVMRLDGVTHLTFGPFQAARPHVYVGSGGTPLSRWVMRKLVVNNIERLGYHNTMNFFKKFAFDDLEPTYNLIWPRRSWIRPYMALGKLFQGKETAARESRRLSPAEVL